MSLWKDRFHSLTVVLLLTAAGSAPGATPADAERVLHEARQALEGGRWDDAARSLAVAEKASDDREFQQRVAVVRRELFTAVRLHEIRHEYPVNAQGYDADAAIAAFRQTFHGYGLTPERPASDEMKRRGRASPIRSQLVAALDEWAIMFGADEDATRRNVLDFADVLDDSDLRRQVRAAICDADFPCLVRLAKRADDAALTPSALLLLANMLDHAGESADAAELLRRGRRRFPEDWRIHLNLGGILLERQPPQAEEAISCLRAAQALRPDLAAPRAGLLMAFAAQDRWAEAEAAGRAAVALQPRWAALHRVLAVVLYNRANYRAAESAAREAVRLDATSREAQAVLGMALGEQEKWPDAEIALRRAISLDSDHAKLRWFLLLAPAGLEPRFHVDEDNAKLLWSLGATLGNEGKLDEAQACLRAALRSDLDLGNLPLECLLALFSRERFNMAEGICREMILRNKDDARAHLFLCLALLRQDKWADGEAECRAALHLEPTYRDFLGEFLAYSLAAQSKFAEAEAIYRDILHRDKAKRTTWSNFVRTLLAQKKTRAAEAFCRDALKQQPNNARIHTALGLVLAEQKRPAEAEAAFRETVRLDPDDADARDDLAAFLTANHRDEEAEAARGQEERWRKSDAVEQEHLTKAYCLTAANRLEEAVHELELARAANAKARVSERLVKLYDALDDPARALAELRWRLADTPDDADLLNEIGYRVYGLGDWQAAENYFREALLKNNARERTWVNLGEVLAAQGRLDESLDAYQHALSSPLAYCNIARMHLSQGKFAAATATYRKALELDPECHAARAALTELERLAKGETTP
jgi:tetratricopeptide (TPR) repeat protein